MSVAQRVSEAEYERLVWAEPDRTLELIDGQMREKPGSTWAHGEIRVTLAHLLMARLDRDEFRGFFSSRVRRPPATIVVPDLMVVPTGYGAAFRNRQDILAIFSDPLPLIVEIWTAIDTYDLEGKLPIYQQRGDLEIWRIHPFERTITSWRRQPDGSYNETIVHHGFVEPVALSGVVIHLEALFDS